jgi:cytochrome c oxidase assembly protein subunit 15
MKLDSTTTPVPPRWLHALAVLTVLFTLPLLFLGAGVTSHGVGMVDPQGFRPPWVIVNGLFENSGLDWRLEYGHRTFGFLVGLCGIFLAVGCWFFDARPWMGWIGFLAIAMICVQGALGIFRVDYNALHGRTFALIHGIFAQLVFAVLVSVALLTSRRWATDRAESASPGVQRWSIITALIVFGQLLLGGLVRHQPDSLLGPRGHLLGAFVVVGAVVWLLMLIRSDESHERFRTQRIALMALLTLQLLLGIESWLAKFYVPQAGLPQLAPMPMHAEWIRTAHYLAGTLIFSTTVVIALIAYRKPAMMAEASPQRTGALEVAR